MMQTNGTPRASASRIFSAASSCFFLTLLTLSSNAATTTGMPTCLSSWVTHTGTHAQRTQDQRALRLALQHHHERDQRLAGAHAHGQQQPEHPQGEVLEAELESGQLVPPRARETGLRSARPAFPRREAAGSGVGATGTAGGSGVAEGATSSSNWRVVDSRLITPRTRRACSCVAGYDHALRCESQEPFGMRRHRSSAERGARRMMRPASTSA